MLSYGNSQISRISRASNRMMGCFERRVTFANISGQIGVYKVFNTA